jgi:hypothetical protein
MADFTITVGNSVAVLGMGAPTLWGAFDWGTGFWGAGSNPMVFDVDKALDVETITTADALSKDTSRGAWSETITTAADATDQTKQDGNGYFYVFTRPTLDAEERQITSYTSGTPPDTAWTEDVSSGPTWSEQ